MLFTGLAQAQLVHSYSLDAAGDPLADSIGSAPLLNDSAVIFGDDDGLTFATFDGPSFGTGDFLVVDESAGAFDLSGYTVTFWFRLETDSQNNWTALFSSGDNNASDGAYQIDFMNGALRLHGSSISAPIATTSELGAGVWHLLTVTQDTIWLNGSPVDLGTTFSLPALKNFALGVNRGRGSVFKGDIADLRIYGSETQWDDTQQASAYAEGPGIPSAPNPGTVILISRLEPTPFDRIARGFLHGTAPRQSPALQQ